MLFVTRCGSSSTSYWDMSYFYQRKLLPWTESCWSIDIMTYNIHESPILSTARVPSNFRINFVALYSTLLTLGHAIFQWSPVPRTKHRACWWNGILHRDPTKNRGIRANKEAHAVSIHGRIVLNGNAKHKKTLQHLPVRRPPNAQNIVERLHLLECYLRRKQPHTS